MEEALAGGSMRQYLYFCTNKASTFVPAGEVADLVQARLRLVGGVHLRVALGFS